MPGVTIRTPAGFRNANLLAPEALAFVAELHRRFSQRWRELLSAETVSAPVDAGSPERRPTAVANGARLVDFAAPDSTSWEQLIERHGRVREEIATGTVIVRPRGLRAIEPHIAIDGQPLSAALFDVGLCAFHGAGAATGGGALHCDLSRVDESGEARLWDEVLAFAERTLGLADGTIKRADSLRA